MERTCRDHKCFGYPTSLHAWTCSTARNVRGTLCLDCLVMQQAPLCVAAWAWGLGMQRSTTAPTTLDSPHIPHCT